MECNGIAKRNCMNDDSLQPRVTLRCICPVNLAEEGKFIVTGKNKVTETLLPRKILKGLKC